MKLYNSCSGHAWHERKRAEVGPQPTFWSERAGTRSRPAAAVRASSPGPYSVPARCTPKPCANRGMAACSSHRRACDMCLAADPPRVVAKDLLTVYVPATCPHHAPAADLTIFHTIKTAAAAANSGATPFRISAEKVKTAAASAVCHFNACPHPHSIMRSNRGRVTP